MQIKQSIINMSQDTRGEQNRKRKSHLFDLGWATMDRLHWTEEVAAEDARGDREKEKFSR